jgi:hypothetical protein
MDNVQKHNILMYHRHKLYDLVKIYSPAHLFVIHRSTEVPMLGEKLRFMCRYKNKFVPISHKISSCRLSHHTDGSVCGHMLTLVPLSRIFLP